MLVRAGLGIALGLWAVPLTVAAQLSLPERLFPPAPFPLVTAQSSQRTPLAPGVVLGLYRLWSSDGPLVVRALSVDLAVPTVRVGTVLAGDHLISKGETVSAMARRTGAIGGINGDYFDIGNTNQPLNLVVRDGRLLRTPSGRAALAVGSDGSLRFGSYRFSGSARDGDRSWALGAVDEWPPQGTTATLVTPAFGPLPATPGATFATLTPLGDTPAFTFGGTFRVASIDDLDASLTARFGLAFGPLAIAQTAVPDPGDTIRLDGATVPPLDSVGSAIGGGPLLVAGGSVAVDPDAPSAVESSQRAPQSGALRDGGGRLVLVQVDGRSEASVGLTRPAFGALLRAFGAEDAMAFDGGGSATLVARAAGDGAATIQNVPSDGRERPVADGLFVYSSASGGPARLVTRPERLDLLPGAAAALEVRAVDGAGVPLALPAGQVSLEAIPGDLASVRPGHTIVARRPGSGTLRIRLKGLTTTIPLNVDAAPAHLSIGPADANPSPGETIGLQLVARDAAGDPLALANDVRWTSSSGTIDADGRFRAGTSDASIVARVGSSSAIALIPVGRRTVPLALFAPATGRWSFATAPRGGPGRLELGAGDLTLVYDFSGETRAAYANTDVPLNGTPIAVSVAVRGDGGGAALRAAFVNAGGERVAVTLARRVDWRDWRVCRADLPRSLARLTSLYLVNGLGGSPTHATGTVALRDVRVTLAGAGTAPHRP